MICFILQLCVALRRELVPPAHLTNIPALDRILSIALDAEPSLPPEDFPQARPARNRYGPVIEITSMSTASGKTHILYQIALLSTLPMEHNDVPLYGKSAAVIVFDTDGRFDVQRLHSIMKAHILGCYGTLKISDVELDTIAREALSHLHVYRPQSSRSMIEMLSGTRGYLLELASHHSSGRRLDAVLIDGLSSFYWQDRHAGSTETESGSTEYQEIYGTLVQRIREVSAQFGAFVVATNWGLQLLADTTGDTGVAMSFRSHLPLAWTKLVDVKLVVQREDQVMFGKGTSVAEALRQRKEITEEKEDGDRFSGWVDVRALSVGVQAGFRDREITRFRYTIGRDGIQFKS